MVQKLQFLLHFSKRFYFADNDDSRLGANKLPNGINLEARWSHMFPDVNTFFPHRYTTHVDKSHVVKWCLHLPLTISALIRFLLQITQYTFASNKEESYTIISCDQNHVERTTCVVWPLGSPDLKRCQHRVYRVSPLMTHFCIKHATDVSGWRAINTNIYTAHFSNWIKILIISTNPTE
jgi:hypothetical protein